MAKHFEWAIDEKGFFSDWRNASSIAAEAPYWTGCTWCVPALAEAELDVVGTVLAYKRLSAVEHAFRSLMSVDLKVRPVFPPHRRAGYAPMSCCACWPTT